tara:strand:+ start:320 stop:622 length:303 start_codon:yes stop_codon:yes gene_type:complete
MITMSWQDIVKEDKENLMDNPIVREGYNKARDKDMSQRPKNRFDVEAGDTMESMLNYAAIEILTLVKSRTIDPLKDLPLKESIIEVINDAIRRVNNISKE